MATWIDQQLGSREEELRNLRDALISGQDTGRSAAINTMFNNGITGGGYQRGMRDINSMYNANIANLNSRENTLQMGAQQGNQFLSKINQIGALQAQYNNAIQKATQMRRGAENQLFDTGAAGEADKWTKMAQDLHNQITQLYGQTQGMDLSNPFVGRQIAGMGEQGNQFNTQANQLEGNISSGKTIWDTVSPLLASFVLPQLGGWLGGAGKMASGVPQLAGVGNALSQVGGAVNNIGGVMNDWQSMIGEKLGVGATPLNDALLQTGLGKSPQDIIQGMVKKGIENKIQQAQEAKWGSPTMVKVDESGNVTTEFKPGGDISEIPKLTAKTGDNTIGLSDTTLALGSGERRWNIDRANPNQLSEIQDKLPSGYVPFVTNYGGHPVIVGVKTEAAQRVSKISEEQFVNIQRDAKKMGIKLQEAPMGTDTSKTFNAPDGKTYLTIPAAPSAAEIEKASTKKDKTDILNGSAKIVKWHMDKQPYDAVIQTIDKDESKGNITEFTAANLRYTAAKTYGKQDDVAALLQTFNILVKR